MTEIKIFQVDAFTSQLFNGNPAAVCMVKDWLPDTIMQSISAENNLAETAFVVPGKGEYNIRWFTPRVEVDLCGHATLAAAFVLFSNDAEMTSEIIFKSERIGVLKVIKNNDLFFLDFPTDTLSEVDYRDIIKECIGILPIKVYKGRTDYIAIVNSEEDINGLQPNLKEIGKLDARGLIVTAKGKDVDFVSRFFAPQSGIEEDPVTGSAHTSLIPLWSKKLGKLEMKAKQLSARGGDLTCINRGKRCLIGGKAILYMVGNLYINTDL